METRSAKDISTEDNLLETVAELKRRNKRLQTLYTQLHKRYEKLQNEKDTEASENRILKAKIEDLNEMVKVLNIRIDDAKQAREDVVTAYEKQTDKLINERNMDMDKAKKYENAYEYERKQIEKANEYIANANAIIKKKNKKEREIIERLEHILPNAQTKTKNIRKMLILIVNDIDNIVKEVKK